MVRGCRDVSLYHFVAMRSLGVGRLRIRREESLRCTMQAMNIVYTARRCYSIILCVRRSEREGQSVSDVTGLRISKSKAKIVVLYIE